MMNFQAPSVVVKNLLIINVIVYFAASVLFPQYVYHLAFYYPALDVFQPYQVITHFFMHGNTQHLLFNMLSLYFLGPMVERMMGAKRFLLFYFICGFGSLLLHLVLTYFGIIGMNVSIVGASGAIMGVFIAFAMYFPDMKLMLLFPPIPVKAKYLVAGLIALDLFSGVSGSNTGIAHFAHLGGALAGFIMMMVWKQKSSGGGPQRWN